MTLYEAISELEQRKEATRQQIENYIVSQIETIRSSTQKNAYTNKTFCDLLDDPIALLDAIIEKKDGSNVKKVYADILLEYER
jgi:cytochrome c553